MTITARMTVGSIFGMITNTASAVGDLAGTAVQGVRMLSAFVESASTDQEERQVVHRTLFRENILREAAMQISEGDAEALAFCNESESNKKFYLEAEEKLKTAFVKHDKKEILK